ncbi:uncharacterized protein [Oscarella lobularis]|uniref:uncharacterized protein n=1 Tax=Oscarella lobularis TaxID=121494 RepID=UPI003313A3C8
MSHRARDFAGILNFSHSRPNFPSRQPHVLPRSRFSFIVSLERPRKASPRGEPSRNHKGGDYGAFRKSPQSFAKGCAPEERSRQHAIGTPIARLGARWRATPRAQRAAPPLAEKAKSEGRSHFFSAAAQEADCLLRPSSRNVIENSCRRGADVSGPIRDVMPGSYENVWPTSTFLDACRALMKTVTTTMTTT